ncbi:MAG: smalltalk protein [Pseudobutyrivibrio sp.]|nr:smalltalk protein [Pseudobutyrivibrio sp.]
MNKDTWKFILQLLIAILTAILTSLGVTSCFHPLL